MKRRNVFSLFTPLVTTISAGCGMWDFEETGPVDIEILNFTSEGKQIIIKVRGEDGDIILNNSYEINGREGHNASVPTITEKGFTEGTNGDILTVTASIQPNGQKEGNFNITCMDRQRTRDVFFVEIREREGKSIIEFEQSTCI